MVPGHEDLDPHASACQDHDKGQVDQGGIAGTVELQLASTAQKEVVGQHHDELHQASQRNGQGDAQQVARGDGQRSVAHKGGCREGGEERP